MSAKVAVCPKCGKFPMVQLVGVDSVLVCSTCEYACAVGAAKWIATKADFKPAKKTRTDAAWDLLESDVVSAIQKALEAKGYTVLRIGQWNAKGSGTTVGTPDLFVHNGDRWHGLEVKRPGGKVSVEQQALADRGLIYIVDNVSDAVRICDE